MNHRWEAIREDAEGMRQAREKKERYDPKTYGNGDTAKQLLARSRYLLFKPSSKWTERQAERAKILFDEFPDIKKAYGLSMGLRGIYEQRGIGTEEAVSKLKAWCEKAEKSGFKSFSSVQHSLYEQSDQIANFFNNRSTNAAAESFNAKIKDFRRNYRGVADLKFFLFRLTKIFA